MHASFVTAILFAQERSNVLIEAAKYAQCLALFELLVRIGVDINATDQASVSSGDDRVRTELQWLEHTLFRSSSRLVRNAQQWVVWECKRC